MALQKSTPLRNNKAAQIAATIGASPLLEFYAGAVPVNCGAAASGTLLASLTLPASWLATPSGGAAAQSGTWTTAAALASGTPTYFRIYDASHTTCHIQGKTPDDMSGSPATITAGSPVSVVSYSFLEGNA